MSEVMIYSQRGRPLAVETALGEDVLLLGGLEVDEGLSRLFRVRLDLFSEHEDIEAPELVGKPVDVRILLRSGGQRWFNGFVSRFTCEGRDDRLTRYSAEVVPWLWLLGRRTDCRIFQEKTVVEIVSEVFRDAGFGDAFDVADLSGKYPRREYCVQYRESDLAFVSRLMEEEGIGYRFDHEQGRHRLALMDGEHAYVECEEGQVSCPDRVNAAAWEDDLTSWRHEYEFVSGRWSARDWNFLQPGAPLESNANGKVLWREARQYEQFDYPGVWEKSDQGDRLSRIRQEEEAQRQEVVLGGGRCRSFMPGGTFVIDRHHVSGEMGREFVLTRVMHAMRADAPYTTGGAASGGDEVHYENRFECIPAERPFRPRRETPRPTVRGIQTAVVVGPSGEEIHVDEHARVKVQFHWDRRGKRDENASCWIRVAQPWAGVGYGGLCIPRIGQEVIIEFEEGDPDRPLINGRIYNAGSMPPVSNAGREVAAARSEKEEQKTAAKGKKKRKSKPPPPPPPQSIPQAAMMTSLKSNSLGGSGGSNEITMNDTGGAEGLFIKAQKDEIHTVGNDRVDQVGNDETRDVGNDRIRTVGNNETVEIGVDQEITVGNNQTLTVGVDQTIGIGANRSVTVGMNETHTVQMCRAQSTMISENVLTGISKSVQTGLVHAETIGMLQLMLIGLKRVAVVGLSDTLVVGQDKSDTINGELAVSTGKSATFKPSKDFIAEAGNNVGLKAASTLVIDCPDITLKGAGGFIRINGSGIYISGKMVYINSGGAFKNLDGTETTPDYSGKGSTSNGSTASTNGSTGSSAPGGAAGAPGSGAPASGGAPPVGEGITEGGCTGPLRTLPTSTGGLLDEIGKILPKIPGLDPNLGSILGSLANGELPNTSAILAALQKVLPPKAQKYLAAVNDAVNQYNAPVPSPDSIKPGGGKGGGKAGGKGSGSTGSGGPKKNLLPDGSGSSSGPDGTPPSTPGSSNPPASTGGAGHSGSSPPTQSPGQSPNAGGGGSSNGGGVPMKDPKDFGQPSPTDFDLPSPADHGMADPKDFGMPDPADFDLPSPTQFDLPDPKDFDLGPPKP